MKKLDKLITLTIAFLTAAMLNGQTIFVNASATGSNSGASWANAFTTLDAALSAANAGQEIWVAQGTYLPKAQTPAGKSTFHIKKAIAIYGGFAGTESSLVQRPPGAYTTLSGDLGSNDLVDDFMTNRLDNTWHVVTIDSVPSGTVRLDGLGIQSARADSTTAASAGINGRGGAIQARAKIEVTNCIFQQNWARSGGAIWFYNDGDDLGGPANGSSVKDCIFTQNSAADQSSGIYARALDGLTADGCVFTDNIGNRGAFYPLYCLSVEVKNCTFSGNKNPGGFGGAVFIWSSTVNFSKTLFQNSEAGNAGAIYIDGRDNLGTAVSFDSCAFLGNLANGSNSYAGAVESWQATVSYSNCLFQKNKADNAGAVYADGRDGIGTVVSFGNCLFNQNEAVDNTGGALYFWRCTGLVANSEFTDNKASGPQSSWGAGAAVQGLGSDVLFDGCSFSGNTSQNTGGAILAGFKGKATVLNSTFEGNTAGFGAAVGAYSDSTEVTVSGCQMYSNTATYNGGAVFTTGGIKTTLTGCSFDANNANFGGAVNIEEDSLDLAVATIADCSFYLNTATTQAGAVNLFNTTATLTNCLFNSNFATDGSGNGTAGAVSNNAGEGKTATIDAKHCTFANNLATLGCSLVQWEDAATVGSKASTTLTNCVFAEPLNAYDVEAGAPTLTSKGGNLSLDDSFSPNLTGTNDVTGVDPKFYNPGQDNFHLAAGSPCIDKGVASAAVAFDLDGLPRDSKPDKGCYEFIVNGTGQPLTFETFTVWPTPRAGVTEVLMKSGETGVFRVALMDARGRLISAEMVEKTAGLLSKKLDLSKLPSAVYLISIEKDGRRSGRAVVKN